MASVELDTVSILTELLFKGGFREHCIAFLPWYEELAVGLPDRLLL